MMTNLADLPSIFVRWEHLDKERYYEVRIHRDLLGDIVFLKLWGRKCSRLGSRKQAVYPSYEATLKPLVQLHQRRLKHGYYLVKIIEFESAAPSQLFCQSAYKML